MSGKRSPPSLPEAEAQPSQKPDRIIRSVEFTVEQWDAVTKAAYVEGHPVSAWVRAAALEKARAMGFWQPFELPGPKKT